jgi:uncharacterized protein (TIGR03067 family)
MTRRSFLTALFVALALANTSAAQDKTTPLEGVWRIVSVAFDGAANSASDTRTFLTFHGNTYTQEVDGTVNERGTIRLDQTKKPMTIDFIITEGATMTQLGIVEVDGETLRLHVNAGTLTRPSDFRPLPENFLIVARRW